MSELTALLTLHGAIDHAVADDSTKAATVARYYGPYQGGEATGWFDQFQQWTADLTGTGATNVLATDAGAIEAAIGELGSMTPSPYMKARRMLVIATAARVLASPVLDSFLNLAPALDGPIGTDNTGLLDLLTNDTEFAEVGEWAAMVQTAFARGHVTAEFVRQNSMAPCAGHLVTVPVGGAEVATLETNFCTTSLTFEQASRVLDPERWPDCNPLWCHLDRTRTSKAGNPIYHEQVSLDCSRKPHTWTADCDLEFTTFTAPGVAIISYDLADQPPQPGDPIQVDSGSLEVRQVGPQVCVRTTKRIRFNYPFTGTALAMVACALGYGPVAEALVFCCAGDESDQAHQPKQKKSKKQGGGSMQNGSDGADTMRGAIEAWKRCVDECADAYQKSSAKAQAGEYRSDDLANDLASMWTRAARDVAAVADLGVRMTRVLTNQRVQRPPQTKPGPPVPEDRFSEATDSM